MNSPRGGRPGAIFGTYFPPHDSGRFARGRKAQGTFGTLTKAGPTAARRENGGVQKKQTGLLVRQKKPRLWYGRGADYRRRRGGSGRAEKRNCRRTEKVGIQALILAIKYLMTQFCVTHVSLRIRAHAAFSIAVVSFPLPAHFLLSRLGKFFWIDSP